ncbi:MAG: GNAT family N-acetyltransferase [Alphaproteobacteria bacterium]|nr:GNAT family N-acetyltransferase [Alphaproteobacteria bacterium]
MKNIHIAPYDPAWPYMFEKEATLIQQALGDNCITVHHIGSTAVPDLAAKPIIDMIPVVCDITHVDLSNKAMAALGYEAKGECGMLFRRYFQKGDLKRTHNVHVYEQGNPEIQRHLLFRDWMQNHANDRKSYEQLKYTLAQKFPDDILSYCMGKESFVMAIDHKTGWQGLRAVKALTKREWDTYHRIRKERIFADFPHIIYDRNHPSLTEDHHHHFLLYNDQDIVCVAHVELLSDQDAALRALATDKIHERKGYGSYMLVLIERWIKHQDRYVIKMHARPNAVSFYRKLGYIHMCFDDDPSIQENPVDLGKIIV